MGQRADADSIDARFGNRLDRWEGHSSRGLQLNLRRAGIAARDRLAELGRRHVVQEYDIRSSGEHLIELIQRVHLDFHDDSRSHRFGNPLLDPTSRLGNGLGRRIARSAPAPSAPSARWLSLISTASYRPVRWFQPPPHRTAYFSKVRQPGVVFRVSKTRALVPATAST